MCDPVVPSLASLVNATLPESQPRIAAARASQPHGPSPAGSRRRRLWELPAHAHCPVIGVCLPIDVLRRVVDRALRGHAVADDYELHCGAVSDSRHRGKVAEALNRELDRRYAGAIRLASSLKTTEALGEWWHERVRRHDIAGPLWALMTHPRWTPSLSERVEGQVHMLQHQLGAATRVEGERLDELEQASDRLRRALEIHRERHRRTSEARSRREQAMQAELLRLRARLMVAETTIAARSAELAELRTALPELGDRLRLAGELRELQHRLLDQQRALTQARSDAQQHRQRARALEAERPTVAAANEAVLPVAGAPVATADVGRASAPERCHDRAPVGAWPVHGRAILCVGGRTASVPVYRAMVESSGARFLHHDGGQEDAAARLDATLASADLVICQTGCISHDAYWRVKDHCRRTGKPCVFVDTPSRSGLRRALASLAAPAGDVQEFENDPGGEPACLHPAERETRRWT